MKKVTVDGLELAFTEEPEAHPLSESELELVSGGVVVVPGSIFYQWTCNICGYVSNWFVYTIDQLPNRPEIEKEIRDHTLSTGHESFSIKEFTLK